MIFSHEFRPDYADSPMACAERHCRLPLGMAEAPGEQQGTRRQGAERCLQGNVRQPVGNINRFTE
uniref:Uncharacterized protein n=1 Tax=Myoviridae sp. ctgpD8 TaxID=2825149 RepID=A0A8S5QHJ3_9CAUD|nr:MAG TPA: hypothetical protein [Myoviridae sp. ctgpD8]